MDPSAGMLYSNSSGEPCTICCIVFPAHSSSLFFVTVSPSLFAAQAGASRVIAVDASEKMSAVAAQVF